MNKLSGRQVNFVELREDEGVYRIGLGGIDSIDRLEIPVANILMYHKFLDGDETVHCFYFVGGSRIKFRE